MILSRFSVFKRNGRNQQFKTASNPASMCGRRHGSTLHAPFLSYPLTQEPHFAQHLTPAAGWMCRDWWALAVQLLLDGCLILLASLASRHSGQWEAGSGPRWGAAENDPGLPLYQRHLVASSPLKIMLAFLYVAPSTLLKQLPFLPWLSSQSVWKSRDSWQILSILSRHADYPL